MSVTQKLPLRPSSSRASSVSSSGIGDFALVGPVQGNFSSDLQPNKEYTSLVAYKSDAADPLLSKNLTQSVAVVERQVNSVRSTFTTVDRIVNDEGLNICLDIVNRASILREWREISEAFEKVLVKSRDVANDGALMIGDFLSAVIPYLLDDGDLLEKQRELVAYRKTLEVGGERADLFATNFHEISCRVREFKQKWEAHTKETMKRLLIEVDKLQSDLAAAANGVDETRRNFCSILAQKRFQDENEPQQGSTKKFLQIIVKEAKQSYIIQKKSDPKVAKHTTEIVNKTNDLVVVWNFIHDDLGIIEGQLRICEKGHAFGVFKQRVEKLAVQYVTLMESLRTYASALAMAGKGAAPPLPTNISFWRKLLGKKD